MPEDSQQREATARHPPHGCNGFRTSTRKNVRIFSGESVRLRVVVKVPAFPGKSTRLPPALLHILRSVLNCTVYSLPGTLVNVSC